jgi:hypothetical protein
MGESIRRNPEILVIILTNIPNALIGETNKANPNKKIQINPKNFEIQKTKFFSILLTPLKLTYSFETQGRRWTLRGGDEGNAMISHRRLGGL